MTNASRENNDALYSNFENKTLKNKIEIKELDKKVDSKFLNLNFKDKTKEVIIDSSINIFNKDNNVIRKIDFKDIKDESKLFSTYIGFNKVINCHLIQFIDSLDGSKYYELISSSGKFSLRLNSFPKINQQGLIVDIFSNFYDNLTYFAIHKIELIKTKCLINCSFDKWSINENEKYIGWLDQNTILLKTKTEKYLKIKLKNVW